MPLDSQLTWLLFTAWALAFPYITVAKGLQLGPVHNAYNLNCSYPMLNIIPQLSEARAKRKASQTIFLTGSSLGLVWMLADLNACSRDPSVSLTSACAILP